MSGGQVTWQADASIGWVTISNVERRNALTAAMLTQLAEAFDALGEDPEVAVIILRGAGGQFCAGADLSGGALNPDEEAALLDRAHAAIAAARQPTIAFIEGNCIGAGLATALRCDLRIAAASARFGVPVARLGLLYPPGSIQRLIDQVGASAAMLLIVTGEIVDAEWAFARGLVDRVLAESAEQDELARFAGRIVGGSRLTQIASKELVRLLLDGRADEAEARFREWAEAARTSGEHAEGIAAFAEKRPAIFPWRLGRR